MGYKRTVKLKCPGCGKSKWIVRSMEAGKRICTKCNLKFKMMPDHWIWKTKS